MRTFKKISAIFLVVAMLFSMMSIGVFADENVFDIRVVFSTKSVGQGQQLEASIYYVSSNGESIDFTTNGFDFNFPTGWTVANKNDKNKLTDVKKGVTGSVSEASGYVRFGSMSASFLPTDVVGKVVFNIPASEVVGEKKFTCTNLGFSLNDDDSTDVTSKAGVPSETDLTVNVVKAFTVATVDAVAGQTAELGDKVADVKAKLANLDVTVKGSAADETATLKATWDCAELADAETITTAKDYTFTGTLQGTDVVTVPEGKTATVKVTVGKIALTDAMVTSTYKNIEIPQTEADATLTAAEIITKYVGDEYKVATISKNGTFEEKDATVAWNGTGEINTSKLTSENAGNKLTLTGTVTPAQLKQQT